MTRVLPQALEQQQRAKKDEGRDRARGPAGGLGLGGEVSGDERRRAQREYADALQQQQRDKARETEQARFSSSIV